MPVAALPRHNDNAGPKLGKLSWPRRRNCSHSQAPQKASFVTSPPVLRARPQRSGGLVVIPTSLHPEGAKQEGAAGIFRKRLVIEPRIASVVTTYHVLPAK